MSIEIYVNMNTFCFWQRCENLGFFLELSNNVCNWDQGVISDCNCVNYAGMVTWIDISIDNIDVISVDFS